MIRNSFLHQLIWVPFHSAVRGPIQMWKPKCFVQFPIFVTQEAKTSRDSLTSSTSLRRLSSRYPSVSPVSPETLFTLRVPCFSCCVVHLSKHPDQRCGIRLDDDMFHVDGTSQQEADEERSDLLRSEQPSRSRPARLHIRTSCSARWLLDPRRRRTTRTSRPTDPLASTVRRWEEAADGPILQETLRESARDWREDAEGTHVWLGCSITLVCRNTRCKKPRRSSLRMGIRLRVPRKSPESSRNNVFLSNKKSALPPLFLSLLEPEKRLIHGVLPYKAAVFNGKDD